MGGRKEPRPVPENLQKPKPPPPPPLKIGGTIQIRSRDEERIVVDLQAATALFAEVLQRLEGWEQYGEEETAAPPRRVDERKHEFADYRRRWQEITGIEVPE